MTKTKPQKQIDLREYAEEAIPFDAVIRKLAHIKAPRHSASKPARKAKKRAR